MKPGEQEQRNDGEESDHHSENHASVSYVNLSDAMPYDRWQQVNIRSEHSHRWKDMFLWRMVPERNERAGHDNEYSAFVMPALYDHLDCPKLAYDETKDWILCNLTRREFVRAEAIAKLTGTEDVKGHFIESQMALGEVLVAHICWSSDDSISMTNPDGDIHRGRWAGDRFESLLPIR